MLDGSFCVSTTKGAGNDWKFSQVAIWAMATKSLLHFYFPSPPCFFFLFDFSFVLLSLFLSFSLSSFWLLLKYFFHLCLKIFSWPLSLLFCCFYISSLLCLRLRLCLCLSIFLSVCLFFSLTLAFLVSRIELLVFLFFFRICEETKRKSRVSSCSFLLLLADGVYDLHRPATRSAWIPQSTK